MKKLLSLFLLIMINSLAVNAQSNPTIYQFKVKDKKNPDTRGSYLLIKKKSDIIDFLNDMILKKDVFTKENTKKENITRTELTILAELYMRLLNDTKKERYFLSKVEYHLMVEKNV